MLKNIIFVHDFEYVDKITKMLRSGEFSHVHLIPLEEVRKLFLLNLTNPVLRYILINNDALRIDEYNPDKMDYTVFDYILVKNVKKFTFSLLNRLTSKGLIYYLDTIMENIVSGRYKNVKDGFLYPRHEDNLVNIFNRYITPGRIKNDMDNFFEIEDERSLLSVSKLIVDEVGLFLYKKEDNEIVGITNNIVSTNIKANHEVAFVMVNYAYIYKLTGMITELLYNNFNVKDDIKRYVPLYVMYLILDLIVKENKNIRDFIETKLKFSNNSESSDFILSNYFVNCPIVTWDYSGILG